MSALSLVVGSGWAAGVNLYAVTLVLGVLARTGAADLPEVLQRNEVLVAAAALYVVEFVVDKIPYLDNAWDAAHTVIRPVGAAVLGAVLSGDVSTLGEIGSAAGAAALALFSHTAKATARAAVNTSPEPVSNSAVSLGEDGLVAVVVYLAVANPLLALLAVAVLLVGGVWLTLRVWRAARSGLRRLRERRSGRISRISGRPLDEDRRRPRQSRPGIW